MMTFIKPDLIRIDGLLMPKAMYSQEKFREGVNYKPSKEDIVIATYPKTGTTWMQYIVWQLLNSDQEELPHVHEMWFEHSPQLEQFGTQGLPQLKTPRILKIHYPATFAPLTDEGRYIYVSRNPWDTCVSFYNNVKEAPQVFGFEQGSLNDFIESFLAGYTPWGDYFEHLSSWYSLRKTKSNILFMSYESMKTDLKGSVLEVAKFLGADHLKRLELDPNLLDSIVKKSSYENMSKLLFIVAVSEESVKETGILNAGKNLGLLESGHFRAQQFFKKGSVGYGFCRFDADQRQRVVEKIRRHLSPFPDLLETWREAGVRVDP